MIPWTERPTELANLLNPAFCGFLLHKALVSYQTEAQHGVPFPLCHLLLPIILHKETRDSLPMSTKTTMLAWLNNHPEARINFAPRVRSLLPYTRESLLYLMSYNLTEVADEGLLRVTVQGMASANSLARDSEEVRMCISRAAFLGKWFAMTGEPSVIYALWGVQP